MNKFSFYTGASFSVGFIVVGFFTHNEKLLFEGIGGVLGMIWGFNAWGFALQREQMKNKLMEAMLEHIAKQL